MPDTPRQRLRKATREAQARYDRARAVGELGEGASPRRGDIFSFVETVPYSVLWVVLEESRGGRFLVVAADLHPAVGSADVATSAESACGALSLRCSFEVWLARTDLATATHSGSLDPETLEKAQRKRTQIASGNLSGSFLEQEVDADLEYQDWLEEGPAPAREVLLTAFPHQEEEKAPLGEKIYLNRFDVLTSRVLWETFPNSQAAAVAEQETVDPGLLQLLQHVHRVSSQPHLGLPGGVDAGDVSQTGWAVVFHREESASCREAIQPLIEHRLRQVGTEKLKVLEYHGGEGWREWLSRHGVAAGQVEPTKVPYYLLLVGPPAKIPYGFELSLGVEYAVGRVSLEEPEDLHRYARSVVDSEDSQEVRQNKKAVFFAPRHPFDSATQRSADLLVKPLMERVGEKFAMHSLWGQEATKANLYDIFHGTEPPALFFGAAQGLSWPLGHPQQGPRQGALVCQDWPSPEHMDPERHSFGAADISDEANVQGMIAFLHASQSGGTQEIETVTLRREPRRLTEAPFVSPLPCRLLALPRGGALAVVGLVEQVWGTATEALGEIWSQPFERMFDGIQAGLPVGQAVKELKRRYATLAIQLVELNRKKSRGAILEEKELVAAWSERNDLRSVVIVGDPAVRLRL